MFRRESAGRLASEEHARRKEEEATKHQRLLSAILDNARGHVCMKDADGRYLYVNAEVERQFGRPRDRIIGKTNEELLPPDAARRVSEFDREVFACGGVVEREELVPTAHGEPHFFLSRKIFVQRPGQPDCLAGISADITAQKKTEHDLRIVLKNSFDVVMQIDAAGIIEWSTPAVVALLGWRPDELAGRPLQEFIHPDDGDAVAALLQNLPGGVAGNLDVRAKRRTGGFRWVNLGVRRPPGDGGESPACIATWHDMEAEVQAREAIDAERVRLKAALDALPDAHVLLRPVRDANRRIVNFLVADANTAACACSKTERSGLVGKALLDAFPSQASAGLMGMYADAMESGNPLAMNDVVCTMDAAGGEGGSMCGRCGSAMR